MVHAKPTTLLALTGLAATATAYKHTWRDHMQCAAAVAQDADYPTCTSPSKYDCFCAQPFDPSRISSAARDVCEEFGIPMESIHRFICDDDGHWDDDDVYDHDHGHYHNCHHAFASDDDDDNNRDRYGYRITHPHRLSHPMMRVSAPESSSSNTAKHNPNVQSKRAYAPGLSPSAASSASAHRALVTPAPYTPDEESDYGNENERGSRVITEIRAHTSCDCSSSTVAAATGRVSSRPAYVHQSAVPVASSSAHAHVHQGMISVSSSSSAHRHVYQTAIPVSSSSSAHAHVHQTAVPVPSPSPTHMHLHQTAIPVSSSSSRPAHLHQSAIPVQTSSSAHAHLHQAAVPIPSSTASASSTLARSQDYAQVHGPASMYVSVPVSVPAPMGVDAQRSGHPSHHKAMASSFMVPSASPSPSPAPSAMTFDGGAAVGVLVPSSVVVLGLTALMAFFM